MTDTTRYLEGHAKSLANRVRVLVALEKELRAERDEAREQAAAALAARNKLAAALREAFATIAKLHGL